MDLRVHRSGDDVLYLTGGTNNVISLYTAEGFSSAVSVSGWRDRLAARDALFARLGIPWRLLLSPEKLSITGLADACALTGTAAVPPAERLGQVLPHAALVDPAGYLRDQHRSGYGVYPATDSHWTTIGAFSAFQWLMGSLGLHPDGDVFAACAPYWLRYHGDLWDERLADIPPDRFERRTLPPWVSCTFQNALVDFKDCTGRENDGRLHTGCATSWRNDAAQFDQRVMLFGSSFSDYRASCSLLTFMAALYFREVHFIWSTSLDPAAIAELRPDLVLVEMPERFLPHCPADDLDLDRYARQRIAACAADAP